jgi:hypothetical protein
MTDGVDTAMHPVQPTRAHPSFDRSMRDAADQELAVGHDSVLPTG